MQRRKFIKLTSLATLPLGLGYCNLSKPKREYNIQLHSDMKTGHLVYEAESFTYGEKLTTDVLIVGAGLAGLSAGYSLKNTNHLICELSDRVGGTSAADNYLGQYFAQGAHYDLAYPNYYGSEVLAMLNELNIIDLNPYNNLWEFADKHFIIPKKIQSQCLANGEWRKEVLPDTLITDQFIDLLIPYTGEMKMPTRLIDEKHHHLNNITFWDFLRDKIKITSDFINIVSYQMRDDYGADAQDISALAGIHYYTCRPYMEEYVELFSPPDGNNYFIQKIYQALDKSNVLLNHLVRSIEHTKNGFKAEIIDIINKKIKTIEAKKVVYAGQKHALKYIEPSSFKLFELNRYAPWLAINFILNSKSDKEVFWQNELLQPGDPFIGFVDSCAQSDQYSDYRILTAYFCLAENARTELMEIEKNAKRYINKAVDSINIFMKDDIYPFIEKVYINVMGHAMPIPYPGYLFRDKNRIRKNKNLVYAGVDNSRLPLLFEAIDSGLYSANLIREK